ncbi:predicted protein [Nematostella vectensis]|uniref:E3 ubiquitin-protein ligase RNF14 n=1 Tax=Nematostella vectensis TaxID=45351 RepID=A7RN84_NEMVE|nr:predicted protein [Nematostella vectensis]|eukprot:XP_001639085.1 predicted protein [Nematostella vectensis]
MADADAQEDELLALASIYDERTFTHSSEEKGGQFNVFLDLPDHFQIREDSAASASSEKDGFECIDLKYLPPIVLNFVMPENYPSIQPPEYTLSCKWLTRQQLSKLCKDLDEIWTDQGVGDVIIFRWTQFLMDEALEVLNIKSPMTVRFHRQQSIPLDSSLVDKRAVQDVASYSLLIASILEYEKQEKARVFDTSYFTCDVCFSEKPGSMCLAFHNCGHVFCCECMTGYFTVQINDGSVKALTCPTSKCESQALPSQVKRVVSEETFAKYDKFLLQSSLDGMSDITYCPRPDCQSPVLVDSESTIGLCPACSFAFCKICRLGYHGVSPCSIKNSEFRKLRTEYLKATEEERALLDQRYGRDRLKKVFEEVVSEDWVKSNCTKCPSCSYQIQKFDGCNKMTCIKCRANFCWLCRSILLTTNPYLHFNKLGSQCFGRLLEGVDLALDEDDDDWFDDFDEF